MSNIPFPNREDRSLSMRDQVIARLRQLNPDVMYREEYLKTLKDHALLTALEAAIMTRMREDQNEMEQYMFDAGMKFQRERSEQERAAASETFPMEAGVSLVGHK